MSHANLDVKANKLDVGYEIGGAVGARNVYKQQLNSNGVGSSVTQTGHIGSMGSSETQYSSINSSGYHTGKSQELNIAGTTVYGTSSELNITKSGIEVSGDTTIMGKTAGVTLNTKDIGNAMKKASEAVANGIKDGVNDGGEMMVDAANNVAENFGETAKHIAGGAQKVASMINFGGVIKAASHATHILGKVGGEVVKHAPEVLEGAVKVAGVAAEVVGEVVSALK